MARAMRTHSGVGDWLLYCADPSESNPPAPRPLATAAEEDELLRQSDLHGVLPAFLRRFPFDCALSGPLKKEARTRNRLNQVFTGIHRYHGEKIIADAANLPVAIIKGPVFARTIYSDTSLRGYTDIDILAAPDAVPRLACILEAHGFSLLPSAESETRGEWKWLRQANSLAMIEVQTDLVHAPAMRNAVSLSYEDIADGPESPAALLIVALIHAGVSHQFERLQHLVDICLAAKTLTTADEPGFELMAERTGARQSAVVGLEFVGRLFGDRRCLEIADALGPVRFAGPTRRIMGPAITTSTMSEQRALHSWRRKIVREFLKRA